MRGLLTDQIHVASALIWAHAATGQLPYSMLAAELMQFAIRRMWNEQAGQVSRSCDRRMIRSCRSSSTATPRACSAACACSPAMHEYRDRARRILDALANEYEKHELFGAFYALAVREVIDGASPAGLRAGESRLAPGMMHRGGSARLKSRPTVALPAPAPYRRPPSAPSRARPASHYSRCRAIALPHAAGSGPA